MPASPCTSPNAVRKEKFHASLLCHFLKWTGGGGLFALFFGCTHLSWSLLSQLWIQKLWRRSLWNQNCGLGKIRGDPSMVEESSPSYPQETCSWCFSTRTSICPPPPNTPDPGATKHQPRTQPMSPPGSFFIQQALQRQWARAEVSERRHSAASLCAICGMRLDLVLCKILALLRSYPENSRNFLHNRWGCSSSVYLS